MRNLNDLAWSRFFYESDSLEKVKQNGLCYVSADDLKKYGGREPRLMAKLDTLAERPQIFEENDINILPVQNGHYILFLDQANKSYFPFKSSLEEVQIEEYTSTVDLLSFDTFPVSRAFSESQAIDFAFVSSLLKYFCQTETMHLTVRGRLSSGNFELLLPVNESQKINVSNVQIEVDAGFENDEQIILLEAKIGRRNDFHIRQLIYPYYQWSQKTKKKVRPIFLTYSNGQYVLTEFAVGAVYGDLEIVSNRAFTINDSEVAVINLVETLQAVEREEEPELVPYPQANDMDKIVDTVQLIAFGVDSKITIAEFFEFDERQSYYYTDAARYLGFIQKEQQTFLLTDYGRELLTLSARTQRTKYIFRQMIKRPSLRAVLEAIVQKEFDLGCLSDLEIAAIIQQEKSLELSQSTAMRRASTVRKWFKWLLKNSAMH